MQRGPLKFAEPIIGGAFLAFLYQRESHGAPALKGIVGTVTLTKERSVEISLNRPLDDANYNSLMNETARMVEKLGIPKW